MVKQNILLPAAPQKRIGIVANMHLLCCERPDISAGRGVFIQMK
jgi:hypothetical protein